MGYDVSPHSQVPIPGFVSNPNGAFGLPVQSPDLIDSTTAKSRSRLESFQPTRTPDLSWWLNRLGNVVANGGIATFLRITDSAGVDYANAYHAFDTYMARKYNGMNQSGAGLVNIAAANLGSLDAAWPTVQGTTLTNLGMTGHAQQMTAGQVCTSPQYFTDGVLFQWIADPGSNANGIGLQVDGVTVHSVDGRSAGSYYYAMPNGPGFHTIGYTNALATGTCTVDSPYVYLGNRTSGYQAWDLSHAGWGASQWAALASLPASIQTIAPHLLGIFLGPDDPSLGSLESGMNSILSMAKSVTPAPSLAVLTYFGVTNPNVNLPDFAPRQDFQRMWSAANNAAHIDLAAVIGTIPSTDSLGWTFDTLHPSGLTAQGVITQLLASTLDAPSSPSPTSVAPVESKSTVATVSSSYTVAGWETIVVCNNTAPITITFPEPVAMAFAGYSAYAGRRIRIINTGTSTVSLAAGSGATLNWQGSTNGPITAYQSVDATIETITNWAISGSSPVGNQTSGALPTTNLTSGTGAQILTTRATHTHTPVTFTPTSTAAATCKVELSPDNVTYSALYTVSVPAGTALDSFVLPVAVDVPATWYIRLTATNATLGATTYY